MTYARQNPGGFSSKALPNVPTISESDIPGVKGFELVAWAGIIAPAGTPKPIIQNNRAARAAAFQSVSAELAIDASFTKPANRLSLVRYLDLVGTL